MANDTGSARPCTRSYPLELSPLTFGLLVTGLAAVLAPFVALAVLDLPTTLDGHVWAVRVWKDWGYFGTLKWLYLNWSGRYSAMALLVMASSFVLHRTSVAVVALVVLSGLFISIRCLAKRLLGGRFGPRMITICALAFLDLYLVNLTSCLECIYWAAGAIGYMGGNIATLATVSMVLADGARESVTRRCLRMAAASVVAFLTVGFGEVTMVVVVCVLGVVFLWRSLSGRRVETVALAALGGSLVGSVVQCLAPGNAAREAGATVHHELVGSIRWALVHGWWWAEIWMSPSTIVAGLIVLLLAAWRIRSPWTRLGSVAALFITVLVGVGLHLGTLFLYAWATNGEAPPRVLSVQHLVLLVSGLLAAAFLGFFLFPAGIPRRFDGAARRAAVAMAVVFLAALWGGRNVPIALRDLRDSVLPYQREWTERERYIGEAIARGERRLEVAPFAHKPKHLYMLDISTNPAQLNNDCYARLLNVESIRTTAAVDEEAYGSP